MTRKDRNSSDEALTLVASEAGYRPLLRNNRQKAGIGLNIAEH